MNWWKLILVAVPALAVAVGIAALARRLGSAIWLLLAQEYDPSASIGASVRLGVTALVFGLVAWLSAVGLPLVAPEGWVNALAMPLALTMVFGSVLLGLASGIGKETAAVLERPRHKLALEREITLKERARQALRRFIPILALGVALQAAGGPVPASTGARTTWVIAIDRSSSVLADDRDRAIERIAADAPALARDHGVLRFLVLRFSSEGLMADSSWVEVPPRPTAEACDIAAGRTLMVKGLAGLAGEFHRRRDARSACDQDSIRTLAEYEAKLDAIEDELRAAMTVTPESDVTTDLVRLLEEVDLVPDIVAMTVVSDGIDESSVSPKSLAGPIAVPTTLVLTRSDPIVYSLETARIWALRWREVDGLDVVPVGLLSTVLPSTRSQR